MVWYLAGEGRAGYKAGVTIISSGGLAPVWTLIRDYLADLGPAPSSWTSPTHLPVEAGGVRHPATRLLQDSILGWINTPSACQA